PSCTASGSRFPSTSFADSLPDNFAASRKTKKTSGPFLHSSISASTAGSAATCPSPASTGRSCSSPPLSACASAQRTHSRISAIDFQSRELQSLGRSRDLRDFGDGHRHGAQDLQRRPHSDEAGRATSAASAGKNGSPPEPNQPALPLQHAEFRFVAGALRSRYSPRADHQAGQNSPPPFEQLRFFRASKRRSRVHRQLSRHRGRALRSRQAASREGTGARIS